VSSPGFDFDPYLSDPARWGVSMAQVTELIVACLDAARAKSVAEVGAFAGDLTGVLIKWAATADARVQAIDPEPQRGLVQLAAEHPELELIRRTSLDALPELPLPDAIVIDGDHNYYTVSEELRLIGERAADGRLPLLFFHDVLWPHGRRDDYFDASAIPPDARHPVVPEADGITPGEPGSGPGGLPYPRSAAHEGGPRNGVLTAIEEFVAGHDRVRLAVVPAFFGFAVAWDTTASFGDELARIVAPFDRHPVLERLEANRVGQLALAYRRQTEIWRLQAQLSRQRAVLERLLDSSAFGVAERLSQLRARAGVATEQSTVSKEEIRRALEGG
jgi:hypothetical protein